MPEVWAAVIPGEPASKANSRRLVRRGKRTISIKSEKAQKYQDDALRHIARHARPVEQFLGPVEVIADVYYASDRPDLDPSLIFDILQAAQVYKNDRQVRRQFVQKFIDRDRPRTVLTVRAIHNWQPFHAQ